MSNERQLELGLEGRADAHQKECTVDVIGVAPLRSHSVVVGGRRGNNEILPDFLEKMIDTACALQSLKLTA